LSTLVAYPVYLPWLFTLAVNLGCLPWLSALAVYLSCLPGLSTLAVHASCRPCLSTLVVYPGCPPWLSSVAVYPGCLSWLSTLAVYRGRLPELSTLDGYPRCPHLPCLGSIQYDCPSAREKSLYPKPAFSKVLSDHVVVPHVLFYRVRELRQIRFRW